MNPFSPDFWTLLLQANQRQYKLFIGHAWRYTEEYDRLVKLLNSNVGFRWKNLSVPAKQPLALLFHLSKSYRTLVRQIDDRISQADCLIVIAGMYVAHSDWIKLEIEAAQAFAKPIIAIEPWGSEKFPNALAQTAKVRVGWNAGSIIAAIRRLGNSDQPLVGTGGGVD